MAELYDPKLEKAWCGPEANVLKPGYEVYKQEIGVGHKFVRLLTEDGKDTGRKVCWYCGKNE